jgi:hypothetical protein
MLFGIILSKYEGEVKLGGGWVPRGQLYSIDSYELELLLLFKLTLGLGEAGIFRTRIRVSALYFYFTLTSNLDKIVLRSIFLFF